MARVLQILWTVIAPIFVLIALGFTVERRLGLELKTLTRLNFWVFVPAFLFIRIYESQLNPAQVGQIFRHFLVFFPILAGLTWFVARVAGFEDRMRRALTSTVLFYNSGNYGIPVAQLAFPHAVLPLQVQSAIVMIQNISNFTMGLVLVAGGRGGRRRDTFKSVLKLPMVYVLATALTMRWTGLVPPEPVYQALHWLERGTVPIAVVTLGAQMAALKVPPITLPLALSLMLRLWVAPVIGFGLVWLWGWKGEVAEALVISTSFPTAVNAALLAYEYDNEPQFAAAAVFYSTLFSALTVTGVIFLAQRWL